MSSEINNAVPTSLSHLVGQKQVIAQVTTAIDAAFEDGTRFEHSLLVGSTGLGKSQLASVIAQEMATEFHEVLGQSINQHRGFERSAARCQGQGYYPYRRVPRTRQDLPDGLVPGPRQAKCLCQRQAVAATNPHRGLHVAALARPTNMPAATAAGPDEADAALRVLFRRRIDACASPSV